MLNEIISRTRRNHGLEHATIHVLTEKHNHFSAQGNSTHRGFYLNIYGDLPEGAVESAVHEAHRRMKNGEHELAVHPNCGTVLLTTATMAALSAQAVFGFEQFRQKKNSWSPSVVFNALPTAILAVVVSLILSRPLGIYLQANYTTDGHLGDLEIERIQKIRPSLVTRLFQMLLTLGRPVKAIAYRIDTAG
ncbi:MAG: hypothetical protein KA314_02680 [Chloroflexi bacterium]|nr:hypothetical protein [Chloroflexota bacterium]MBP8054714.1 hypothetical protein [Chloroflexota bacterium]